MRTVFFILFIYCKLFSQEKIQVLNSEDNSVVPFVNIWCEHSKFGTSADENGLFINSKFNQNDTLVLSAIGFETKKITLLKDVKTILLTPKIKQLNEIVLVSKKIKIAKINKIKKTNFNVAFAEKEPTNIIAKYFPFDEKYFSTPFVKSIEFRTLSSKKNTLIIIHIYEATEKGEPGNYLSSKNQVYQIPKGNRTIKIDLSNLNIEFPKKGVFIGIEVPKVKENEAKENQDTKEFKIYEPLIRMSNTDSIIDTWVYKNGHWELNQKLSLALELSLSN